MYAPITSGCGALEWSLSDAPSITRAHFVLRCFIQYLIPLCGFYTYTGYPFSHCIIVWFSLFYFKWNWYRCHGINVGMYAYEGGVCLSVNVYVCAYIFKWLWESDTMLIQWNVVFIAASWLSWAALMVLFPSACFIMRFLHRHNLSKSVQHYSFISFMCTRQDQIIITATQYHSSTQCIWQRIHFLTFHIKLCLMCRMTALI